MSEPEGGGGLESGSEGEGSSEAANYRHRREACLRDLLHLEAQFADLRHKLYQERLSQVESRLGELKAGRGWEYQRKVAELEQEIRQRSEVADILRQFQVEEAALRLEAARSAAAASFENARCLRLEEIKEDIQMRTEKLRAAKRASDLSLALWLSEKAGKGSSPEADRPGSSKRKRHSVRNKVHVVAGQPVVVHMLREEDIASDWATIRSAVLDAQLAEQQRLAASPPLPTGFQPPPPPSLPSFILSS